MLDREIIELQKRGVEVRAYLKDHYKETKAISSGSHFAYDIHKLGTNRHYTVRFQFLKLSFMGLPNQYRAISCNCPRFTDTGECHHALIAIDAHGETENSPLPLETFGKFQLSKKKKCELAKQLAA